jgi:arginine decarboxylase
MLNQNQTPLLDTLTTCAARQEAPFYTPGHKRGGGISPKLADYFGKALFRADLPELEELDNLFAPSGVIQQAQQLAAEAFGAAQTWFLVNGSTCGIEAAILATCNAGDKIILPRNVHSSAIAGLILSSAIPVFVYPEYDSVLDIAHSINPSAIEAALREHPDAKAVMMVYPTYYGVCGDVSAIASLCHDYNIPLLVDEAHGAHFAFHPQLPISALAAGADLTVQSIHKTLGAMTQASMLHVQGDRIDRDRICKALQLVQSTSPSYILMASLDAARQQMALHGKELMSRTLQLADDARSRISQIPGLSVLNLPHPSPPLLGDGVSPSPIRGGVGERFRGFVTLDRTRLTVTVSGLGLTGFEADEILTQKFGVTAEFPSLQHLTFIISLGNTQEDIEQLVAGFAGLAGRTPPPNPLPVNEEGEPEAVSEVGEPEAVSEVGEPEAVKDEEEEISTHHPLPACLNHSELWDDVSILGNFVQMSPREAFFAATETLSINKTINRICAEIVCPYPPGIPVLMPGEVITKEALEYLQNIQAMGGFISGCADSSLRTLQVVKL